MSPTRYFKNFSSQKGGKERNYIGGQGREGEAEERYLRKEQEGGRNRRVYTVYVIPHV